MLFYIVFFDVGQFRHVCYIPPRPLKFGIKVANITIFEIFKQKNKNEK